jgi:DNA helicase-2/ATP-dependent DNA helicase PcrA
MHSDLTKGLNPEQLAAVSMGNESALIIAGAGSGKTRVLTTRIAWLLQTHMAAPSNILAVTFTNKAAKEMLARVNSLLPISPRQLWIGTFHGLCHRLLRIHYRDAGLPELFQIIDMQDQLRVIKRLLKGLNIDEDMYPPKSFQYYINHHKEEGERAHKLAPWDAQSELMKTVYYEYEQLCQREGIVDFAELLLRSYELLHNNHALREHYQARFTHILIDEFQDTNRLQYAWLKLLAGENNVVFAVGDDDQSIYAFRGANVGNMTDFQQEFHITHVIRLEQNYRSQGNILEAANVLIAHNPDRLGKNLWTQAEQGEPIRVFQASTDFEESEFIVEEVRELQQEGLPLNEIALLYRSNAQSRALEHALFIAGIPYRVYGGLRFFERQEIKHALSYLRLIINPEDDNALLRVINFPTRGIGSRSIEALQEAAARQGTSLWQAACTQSIGRSTAALHRFILLIENMRQSTQGFVLTEVIEHMLHESGLLAHYQAEKDGEDRVANLEELVNAAASFLSEYENNLIDFVSHAALEAGDHQAGAGQEAVQLMTVHAAKGLEFHTVFITGLEEGLFPHENSLADFKNLAEERRLMYVAITRARRALNLSFAQSRMLHGQTRYALVSRFLAEIPENLLKWINRGYAPVTQFTAFHTRPSNDTGFHLGQTVVHSKFGSGVITNFEGSGKGANVEVNFQQYGKKWLALAYAKLQPAVE